MRKRCSRGKSCGATCINQSMRCVLELGPLVSENVNKVRDKLGIMMLWNQAKQQKAKGYMKKFQVIKKQVEEEKAGGRVLRQQAHLKDFQKRLREAGLIPKSTKDEDVGDIFAKAIQQKPKSVPADLKAQLAGLGAPASPAKPSSKPKMDSLDAMMADISRIMRGSIPSGMEIASAGDELGIRARTKPTEVRNLEKDFKNLLGTKAGSLKNIDQLREAAAKEANDLSLAREKAGGQERKALRDRINRLESVINRADNLNATATGNTRWARVEAKDFDDALTDTRREGSKSYKGWEDSHGSGARKIGEGSYGTVIKNPDGTFVKRGAISDTEAALIKRLGDSDLGPKLKAADINGEHPYNKERFVDIRNGRIAMGEVPGKPIGQAGASKQFGGKNAADVYWKAMADLHRMGIAHNDAHIDNILVDDKGKGRWVDLGLAQASPKAALAEAMGVFKTLRGGDDVTVPGTAGGQGNWQTLRWDGTGSKAAQKAFDSGGKTWTEFQERFPVASKLWTNQAAAVSKLERLGLDVNEINSIIAHGIRSPMESYAKSDGFSRITDKQAQEVLDTLYDGI